jgi:hypothetical protein
VPVAAAAMEFGRHRVEVDGDLLTLRLRGRVSQSEAVEFHAMLAQLLSERGRCFLLVDLRELESIDPGARRHVGEWNRSHQITAGAAFGANFAVRALMSLFLGAIKLMASDAPEIHMARDEADARRWLDARRAR